MSDITTQQVTELSEKEGITKQQAYGLLLQADIEVKQKERQEQLEEKLEEVEELLNILEMTDNHIGSTGPTESLTVQQTVIRHLVYIYKELLGE